METILPFLSALQQNNHRDWFTQNKPFYQQARAEFSGLFKKITRYLEEQDVIDRQQSKIFRIYRDVRFSADKSPYKSTMSAYWSRLGAARRGGYYLQIQPGGSFLAGGFFRPSKEDLALIRGHLQQEPERLRAILAHPELLNTFGPLEGEQVKTAPRGYNQDDPAIDLLRYKQFMLHRGVSDRILTSTDYPSAKLFSDYFARMRPFLDYMTEVLTTDLNGRSLLS